ncbi:MAG: Three-deoxy-D-manno-octulosonic-acid transferase domain protein [Magnetococcales bacterium]|nr:Three-deoxy-D-manno-octulosonic-acid transferase domain protein [Magnetococcales bacterium]HIJ83056.1 3-deoxy-D-manno-octulosonic acid transferase [Magnetococcales bacterium]
MIHLYSLSLFSAILLTLPYWIWRYFTTPKYRGTVLERFGLGVKQRDATPRIWIHAVSVGETLAAQGLVGALRQKNPDFELVLSTVTKTGRQMAREKLTGVAYIFHLPVDLPWVTRRVMERIRPTMMIIMETELWPSLFASAAERQVPVVIVNGRISPGSFKNYKKARFFMRRLLAPVRLFVMQSAMDAQRIETIGATKGRIRVSGNIKYDQALIRPSAAAMAEMEQKIGRTRDPVMLAASTHPGEEETILRVYRRLRENHPQLRLIVVPRHPERAGQVTTLIKNHGWDVQPISQSHGLWENKVLLVDQVGWLTRIYGISRLVYMGGSLVAHGGQNMLEAAAWELPTAFGPHTFNFKDVSRLLLEAEAAFLVQNEEDLFQAFARLLAEPDTLKNMGQAARQVVETNAGALSRTMQEIHAILEEQGYAPTAPPA